MRAQGGAKEEKREGKKRGSVGGERGRVRKVGTKRRGREEVREQRGRGEKRNRVGEKRGR